MIPKAKDIMTTKLITVSKNDDINEVIELFISNQISGAPVVENGKLIGIISEKDIMKVLTVESYFNLPDRGRVEKFMSTALITITSDMDLYSIADVFLANHYRRLPVVDGEKIVGLVSRRNILSAILELST